MITFTAINAVACGVYVGFEPFVICHFLTVIAVAIAALLMTAGLIGWALLNVLKS